MEQEEPKKKNTKFREQKFAVNCCADTTEDILKSLETTEKGLSDKEAKSRQGEYGFNEPPKAKKHGVIIQIISKFLNPLVIVLLIIALNSYFLSDDKFSAYIVGGMIFLSVFISFFQEYRSDKEVEKLMAMVKTKATVYRNGKPKEIDIREIVPGDIVDLYAGDMIPADLRIFSSKDLFVNQATLTGESMPVEKTPKPVDKQAPSISEMSNVAFMGSSVVSGTGLGVVTSTGVYTQFGELSSKLASVAVSTSFEKGVTDFTWVMIRAMIVMVTAIFLINTVKAVFFHEHIEIKNAFLFAIAIAVGLTPEMLPLILAINLTKGAMAMSKKKVVVKRINSIQNFGAMDVLCTDKTGTLTMDRVVLEKHCDVMREESEDVLKYAFINSYYQTGLKNILDKAVIRFAENQKIFDVESFRKIDEIPFDFERRIMSVVVEMEGKARVISKGAPEEIYKRCDRYLLDGEIMEMEPLIIADLKTEYDTLSADGFRVLALAYKDIEMKEGGFTKDDESGLILVGYVAFLDPPKLGAKRAIVALKKYGIRCMVLTGDNELVTKKICGEVGLDVANLMTGAEMEKLSDDQLREQVKTSTVFARLSPVQKERVIHALHANKHIVGFLGDGINDALALKASDIGISVNNAADIAKESADIILLEKSLMVLEDGVIEGRKTFSNVVKYIKMAASSNFGNMISMTGASLFLPFLPMAAIQVLLNNFLYDLSQTTIPTDEVDEELIKKPKPWDVKSITRFMLTIGPVSSIFDFTTFAIMYFIFKATAVSAGAAGDSINTLFSTGWFLESLITQTLVIFVIRTTKVPIIQSRPSSFLTLSSLLIIAVGISLPFIPYAQHVFKFVAPPVSYFILLEATVAAYLVLVYFVQQRFVKKYGSD